MQLGARALEDLCNSSILREGAENAPVPDFADGTCPSPVGVQVVGDDILVTNPTRVKKAIDGKVVNALLLKVNQIGTVTESIEAVRMSKEAGWGVMTSHRWVPYLGTAVQCFRPRAVDRSCSTRPAVTSGSQHSTVSRFPSGVCHGGLTSQESSQLHHRHHSLPCLR